MEVVLILFVLTINQISEPITFSSKRDCEIALEQLKNDHPNLQIQGSCVKPREPFK